MEVPTTSTRGDPLLAAAERLILREGNRLEGDLRANLDRLVASVLAARDGSSRPSLAPLRRDGLRLLRLLRTEVLEDCSADRPLLEVMRALEETQKRLLEQGADPSVDEVLTPFSRSILREVAHMMRSPLGSIVMLADTLRDQGAQLSAERRDKQLLIIYRAALGVAELAGDLLTLVREDEEVEPSRVFSPVRMLELVADVAAPVAEVKGCEVAVSAPEDATMAGPESTLARVMLAMALQAVLRARDGSVRLEATWDAHDRVTFAVVGHGTDVVPEGGVAELLQVFRVDPDTDTYTLSAGGLGLEATQKRIRSMGSELHVDAPADDEIRLAFSMLTPAPG